MSSSTSPLWCLWSSGGIASWILRILLFVLTVECFLLLVDREYDGSFWSTSSLLCGDRQIKSSWLRTPPEKNGTTNFDGLVDATTDSGSVKSSSKDLPTVFDGVQARVFEPWGNKSLPCVEAEVDWKIRQSDPAHQGFLFVKPYKTGSSTASGINLRLARNVAKRQEDLKSDMCLSRSDHVRASNAFPNRNRQQSFMWTVLREPTRRLVSQYFHFHVSRHKQDPTDANFLAYVKDGPLEMIHDYYYQALSVRPYDPHKHPPQQPDHISVGNQILNDYDFIGITERMDESIVVMSMLLNVSLSDVLYLTAKGHGGFDDGGGRNDGGCTYIWPSFVSPGMQKVLDSDMWRTKSHWDRVLYQAAHRSLDLTIDMLGRELFETKLALYRHALQQSREQCLPTTTFPCSEGGKYTPPEATDCLWKDSGCGGECLDKVAHNLLS